MKDISILLSFVCLVFIISCNNKEVPLQNPYKEKPYEFSTTCSKEQVWNKLVGLITAKGFIIKTSDKNDGLITTDNSSFLNSYSWKKKDGNMTNPNAFVVCSRLRWVLHPYSIKPDSITGQWTIKIKEESNKTVVDTKLVNPKGKAVIESYELNDYIAEKTYNLTVVSTGIFEKSIENALK